MVVEQRPTLSTVSIMPGIDMRAPVRQETSSGFSASPYFMPIACFGLLQGRRPLRRLSDWGNLPSLLR